MRKKVFEYIKEHTGSGTQEIAKAINEDETEVLKAIKNLLDDGCICLCPPVPLSIDNSCSCRYKVLKQNYTED